MKKKVYREKHKKVKEEVKATKPVKKKADK